MKTQIIEVYNNLRELGYSVEEIEVEACYKKAAEMLAQNGVEVQVPSLTVVIEDNLFGNDKYYQRLMEEANGCSLRY